MRIHSLKALLCGEFYRKIADFCLIFFLLIFALGFVLALILAFPHNVALSLKPFNRRLSKHFFSNKFNCTYCEWMNMITIHLSISTSLTIWILHHWNWMHICEKKTRFEWEVKLLCGIRQAFDWPINLRKVHFWPLFVHSLAANTWRMTKSISKSNKTWQLFLSILLFEKQLKKTTFIWDANERKVPTRSRFIAIKLDWIDFDGHFINWMKDRGKRERKERGQWSSLFLNVSQAVTTSTRDYCFVQAVQFRNNRTRNFVQVFK